ncbi:(2Fe-2S)-binding protein [Streptomyces sp. NPDC059378]|uniref:(2Fe-2S)-binding protein n=1 Tax=Streptomyces sp. NPDC059378 TaxID=3346815 RepID=UPI0036B2D2F4
MRVSFTVNGCPQEADDVWEGESLLYVLRERMGLPGSKNACEQGECGSCTVRLDGVPVCACLVAAGQAEGRDVVTVEGLAEYAKWRAERGGCPASASASVATAAVAEGRTAANTPGTADGSGSAGTAGTAESSTPAGPAGTSLDEARRWAARGQHAHTGDGVELSPVQQAFIDAGAVQCGFCTPGLLVAADEMLERNPDPSDADIREALSGNLCRCTGYEKIMDAVRLAAARQAEEV